MSKVFWYRNWRALSVCLIILLQLGLYDSPSAGEGIYRRESDHKRNVKNSKLRIAFSFFVAAMGGRVKKSMFQIQRRSSGGASQ